MIKFVEYRFISYAITFILFAVLGVGTYMHGGFNWGIDFMGGIKVIAGFPQGVDVHRIRQVLRAGNINAEVQQYGDEALNQYVISAKLVNGEAPAAQEPKAVTEPQGAGPEQENVSSVQRSNRLIVVLQQGFPGVSIVNSEEVGPAIGDYLKKSALYLIAWCIGLMGIYLAFRFEYRFAVTAMIGLVHDVMLSFLFCGMMRIEINIPIVAGVLTIFGYSINDTVVVYDRIRENMTNMAKKSFLEICDVSITQTLKRTILTTFTTLIGTFCLYMIGVEIINDFALMLLFGFSLGVFSTVGVSTPLIYEWQRLRAK